MLICVVPLHRDQEQWAQCDSCSKWRRLPLHILLPAKWTCSDNIWDSRRCISGSFDLLLQIHVEARLVISFSFLRYHIAKRKRKFAFYPCSGLSLGR